jgi:plastocyanin
MTQPSLSRRFAPAVLLVLAACGREEVQIDPVAVARYGAFRYEPGETTTTGGGGTEKISTSIALPAGGQPPAPAPGAPSPEPPAPAAGGGARPKKAGKYEVAPVNDGGTVRIVCKSTKPIAREEFKLNKDQPGCGHTSMPLEIALVQPETLGLGNCVVYLVDITKGKDWEGDLAKKAATVVLDQKGCRYEPHVQIVRQGSKLEVKNSDPVQHNVKAFLNTKATLKFNLFSSSNQTLPATEETTLDKPGTLLLACDIHYWMNGFVRVVPHPYYAVTAADGTATLTNVPPGTYKVGCWHEGMLMTPQMNGAEIENYKFSIDFELPPQDVTVTAGGTAEVTFTVEPR